MADDVLELADRLWRGETSTAEHHPFSGRGGLVEPLDGVAFVPSFANVSAVATDAGLVLVDTGSEFLAKAVHQEIRRWSSQPLHTAVYSHGHIDHVFGVPVFEEEAASKGWPAAHVIAHEALPHRFDRYILTAGYNGIINQRQFRAPNLRWPTEYRYPDETYRDRHQLTVGDTMFELHHARGETDDHTWTWAPSLRLLFCGDLFIWASPNAGNPQKVQRYPREWAQACRVMATLGAEVMLPGHGFPVVGAGRIREALTDTADLLDSLHDQTVALMNEGARLNDILHTVRAPSHLIEKPYLRPVYDDPEFVVRNVWRLYGGWYDGDPSQLKPAADAALAAELAALAGGANRLAARAAELAADGSDPALRLAGHLAELAALAAGAEFADDPSGPSAIRAMSSIHAIRAEVFERRVAAESSLMAKGIFGWAASESRSVP
jgi:glyoxylase-like metal-dependent hydrolase (beta-lactamase superfamily II)